MHLPPYRQRGLAVEQASFYEHGGDRTQENFKGKNLSLNEVADANGLTRPMLVWAKAVWDAAEASRWRLPGAVTLPRVKPPEAPAGKTGLSADARQAGAVTTGRAACGSGFLNAPRPHAPAALANEQGTIPSVEEEDLRRSHRERDRLVRERTAHINRIKGLLFGPLPFP